MNLTEFDNQSLLSLDLRNYLSEVRSLKSHSGSVGRNHPLSQFLRNSGGLRDKAILMLADSTSSFYELRQMIRPINSSWQSSYLLLVKYFIDNGYQFKCLEHFAEDDPNQKVVFTRYDVHIRDLPGLYGYLDVNIALGIPSNTYLFWDYSKRERDISQDFENIVKFAGDTKTNVGFHTSPIDSYTIWTYFDGDEKKQVKWLRNGEGKNYLSSLANDQEKFENFISAVEKFFEAQSERFLARFPQSECLAAHGGAIGLTLRTEFDVRPSLINPHSNMDRAWNKFSGRNLLAYFLDRTDRWKFESDHMPYKYNYTPISDSVRNVETFLNECRNAIEKQRAVELLLHPATLAGQNGHDKLFDLLCKEYGIAAERTQFSYKSQVVTTHDYDAKSLLPNEWCEFSSNKDIDVEFVSSEDTTHKMVALLSIEKERFLTIKGPVVEMNLKQGSCYRFQFRHSEITDSAIFKPWIIFCDDHGAKLGEPVRRLFRSGEGSSLDVIPNNNRTQFFILLQIQNIERFEVECDVKVNERIFPFVD